MACCDALLLYLERVIVHQKTRGWGDDELLVTVESAGRWVAEPRIISWPAKPPGEVTIEEGEFAPSRPVQIARIEPDKDCNINFKTTILIWESDANDVNRALKATTAAARIWASDLIPAPAGTSGILKSGLEAVEGLIQLLIDTLGLGDDYMGSIEIGAQEQLTPTKALKDWTWLPRWDASDVHVFNNNEIRFKTMIKNGGGKWEVWILAQRVCPQG